MWGDVVERYWEEERLIPLDAAFNQLKKELLDILRDQGEIALKDDKDVRAVLHDNMLVTINRLLKKEKQH